ncbi:MAG: sigma-70 family RNA polymerase sigma factor [Thermomicrobiales bacterium]|nr:sigma-70 family RNA polymerase sigma factor [Thermomicrobiales bacterium]
MPERGLIDPELDRAISDFARQQNRADPRVRNMLYVAYAPRMRRMLVRLWYRNLSEFGCERDDLEQELFLIFALLLERWSGDGSLSAYLHGAIPWRLYDAARTLAPRPARDIDRCQWLLVPDESHTDAAAMALLEELADRFAPFDRTLLLWHVRDGMPLAQIARSFGLSARTVRRSWLRLQDQLRAILLA